MVVTLIIARPTPGENLLLIPSRDLNLTQCSFQSNEPEEINFTHMCAPVLHELEVPEEQCFPP